MTKEQFISLIEEYKGFDNMLEYYSNIINIESPLFEFGYSFWNFILESNFNQTQIDWINWWLYEYSDSCQAYDEDDNEIDLDSTEKLWDFIQQYGVSSKS